MTTQSIPAELPPRRLVAAGILAISSVTATGYLLRDTVPPIDRWLIENAYAAPGTTAAAVAETVSGAGTLLAFGGLLLALAVAWRRQPPRAVTRGKARLRAGLTLLALPVCVSLLFLQPLINRAGPPQQPELGTYPSGHATISAAAVAVSLLLLADSSRRIRQTALAIGLTTVVLVGTSRIVLAEHWLLDVAGAVIGVTGLALLTHAATRR